MDKSRFKNYGLWVAIFALVPLILQGFGLDILPKNYQEIVSGILGILVMAGILNNPTTETKGFLDDKSSTDTSVTTNTTTTSNTTGETNTNVATGEFDQITQDTIDRENSQGR